MKYCFILNPNSGKAKKYNLKDIIKNISIANNIEYIILETTKTKNAENILAEYLENNDTDVIIACGGDGTINEVLQLAVKKNKKLGIIPVGTVNVAAIELNIPNDPEKALKNIYKNNFKTFDIGKLNKKYFLLMSGFGFDAQIVKKASLLLKKIIGKYAYLISFIISSLFYKEPYVIVNINKKQIYGYHIIIQNFKKYAGNFVFFDNIKNNDNYLDVLIFKTNSPTARIMNIIRCIFNIKMKNIVKIRTKKLKLRSLKKIPVQFDGELTKIKKAEIKIIENGIQICI